MYILFPAEFTVLRKLIHFETFMIAKVIHSIAYFGVTGVYFTDPKGERPWQVWRLVIALVRVKAERSKRKSTVREQGDVF